MMYLKNKLINLRNMELGWLPWLGKTGKIARWGTCFLNKNHYATVEKIFMDDLDWITGQVITASEDVRQTNEIHEAIEQSSHTIQNLKTHTEEMGKTINVINEIAHQTSLLALNSTIEAARAGEEGRGCAVVADALSTLAEPTTKASTNIRQMIKNVQSKANGVVSSMANRMQDSVTSKIKHSVEALNRSDNKVRITASKLHILTGQFQISASL